MTTHNFHPSDDALLHDNCPRCAEQAKHPTFTLDNNKLRLLTRKAYEVETGGVQDHYNSIAEADAAAVIWEHLLFLQKISRLEWTDIEELLGL